MYKPMKRRAFERWIRRYGWTLEKGSIDWKLIDDNGNFQCTIKVTHPGGEVPAGDVKKTEKRLKGAGKE